MPDIHRFRSYDDNAYVYHSDYVALENKYKKEQKLSGDLLKLRDLQITEIKHLKRVIETYKKEEPELPPCPHKDAVFIARYNVHRCTECGAELEDWDRNSPF